jgi:hypothetical protein
MVNPWKPTKIDEIIPDQGSLAVSPPWPPSLMVTPNPVAIIEKSEGYIFPQICKISVFRNLFDACIVRSISHNFTRRVHA